MLRAAFQKIVDTMTAETKSLSAATEPGLERRSVLVSLDVDLAALVIVSALITAGPVNEDDVIAEIARRAKRYRAKFDAGPDALDAVEALNSLTRVPGNGTVN